MDELDALMAELAAARTAGRTSLDRYREFRKVFLDTDEGKRVLYDILALGHLLKPSAVRGDPYETYRREGERNIALQITAIVHVEPRERPERQITKDKE